MIAQITTEPLTSDLLTKEIWSHLYNAARYVIDAVIALNPDNRTTTRKVEVCSGFPN